MMKQKYEFSVRMQQRNLKAIVEVTAQALPWGRGIGSASAAFRTGGRTLGQKRGRLEVKDGDGEEGNPPVSAVLRV